MNFDELRECDQRLFESTDEVERIIPGAVGTEPVGTAATALAHLVGSMSSLKDGYLDLVEEDNTYSSCVILRVFLEHSLRALAIFLQSSGKKFALAEGYMQLRGCEAKDYMKALNFAGIEESDLAGSPLKPWLDMGSAIKEPKKVKDPFTVKELIGAIRMELGDTDTKSFLLRIVPNYAELSAFVHGGPSTSFMEELREQNCLADSQLVVSMFYSTKRYLLTLAATINPRFEEFRARLDKAMNESELFNDSSQ